MNAWEVSGVMPVELDFPEPPYPVLYLWHWFLELHNSRQYSMDGAMATTYTEIKAWAELTGRNPTQEDIRIIKQLDLIAIKNRK